TSRRSPARPRRWARRWSSASTAATRRSRASAPTWTRPTPRRAPAPPGAPPWATPRAGPTAPSPRPGAGNPRLLPPSSPPVAAPPLAWSDDSAVSTLRYRADRSIVAPTIVSLPPRRFPDGAAVSCDGCAYVLAPGRLSITTPPPGDPVVVTVRHASLP